MRPVAGSVVFAVVWGVAAAVSPTTTFHLAPAIVAAWAATTRQHRTESARFAVAGLAVAWAATAVLSVTGLLRGPSLLSFAGPAAESVLAASIGAVVGLVVGLRPGARVIAS
ncbi:MAG TPA: hypothetical protein VGC11_16375 [Acidimicrobiia bacterium]|jgi:hypothetical protein